MKTVSILMPVYNGARFLRDAVDSILEQTFRDWELIAVDDGSTDQTRAILDGYARRDRRVRVISRRNTGIVGALNDALAVGSAPYTARMDADDVALPSRLVHQLGLLESRPELLGCGTAVYFIDQSGAIVDCVARALDSAEIELALLRGDGGALIHPTTMFRTQALRDVGGYRKEAEFTEDLDLYLRLMERGPLVNLSAPLLQYRVHFGSTNFVHAHTKAAIKREVLRAAHVRRQIPFDETCVNLAYFLKSPAQFHREWAESSSRLGYRSTAFKHATLALVREPTRRSSYSMLNLVMSRALHPAPLPLALPAPAAAAASLTPRPAPAPRPSHVTLG